VRPLSQKERTQGDKECVQVGKDRTTVKYLPQDLKVQNGGFMSFDHVCDHTTESEELFEVGVCLNAYPL
jgi:hypothetical protein